MEYGPIWMDVRGDCILQGGLWGRWEDGGMAGPRGQGVFGWGDGLRGGGSFHHLKPWPAPRCLRQLIHMLMYMVLGFAVPRAEVGFDMPGEELCDGVA